MSDVKEFDTRPAGHPSAESPLAWSFHRQAPPREANAGVTLREHAFLGHLILRGGAIVLDEAVREVLGIALPARPNTLTADDGGARSIQWLSPDEWLVVVPAGEEFALERRLREALGQAHFSIVNVSGGQTRHQPLGIAGPRGADEVDTLRCAPSGVPGGQGGHHGIRQGLGGAAPAG